MSAAERLRVIQMLEKMKTQEEYARRLGLKDTSKYRNRGNKKESYI